MEMEPMIGTEEREQVCGITVQEIKGRKIKERTFVATCEVCGDIAVCTGRIARFRANYHGREHVIDEHSGYTPEVTLIEKPRMEK